MSKSSELSAHTLSTCSGAECVCNTLGEQVNVFYNVIVKTVEVAYIPTVGSMRGGGGLEDWPS